MSITLYEFKDLPQLDYAGWETVDFDKMMWYFNQRDGSDTDERRIRRVSEHDWLIEDDHGNMVNFDQGCGETSVLEEYYQEWLAKR